MADRQLRIAHYFALERERARMKQKAVADALGVTVPTLSRYENGKTPMSARVIQQLASLYGVDPEGWKDDAERAKGEALRMPEPARAVDATTSYAHADLRYWAARWDQAVSSLRHVLAEQAALADELRDQAFTPYRMASGAPMRVAEPGVTPPVTPERLAQRIADQTTPDVLATDDSARARG